MSTAPPSPGPAEGTMSAGSAPAGGKGLAAGRLGLFGSTVIGVGSTAPLYSLAATLGYIVIAAGTQAPVAILVAFVLMWLTAYSYAELSRAVPDAGTAFTWATKAFGPRTGWFAGWGVFVAGVIVMSSQTEVASRYLLMLLGDGTLAESKVVVTAFGVVIMAVMTYLTYRAVETGMATQYVLMAIQFGAIALFAVGMLLTLQDRGPALEFSWDWFNPFAAENPVGFVQAVLFSIFIFWGWDTCLALAEETKNPRRTPGLAALLSCVVLVITYVGITVLAMVYSGVGDSGTGLSNEEFADDVFYSIRADALGEWGWVLVLAVAVSALSTTQTTILPTARGTFAMGIYRALPGAFATVSPRYRTPAFSTVFFGVVSAAFYVGMTIISEDVLADSIESTSLAVAMFYTITSFSCIAYFRGSLFASPRNMLFRFLLPLLGGLAMGTVFVWSASNMLDPEYGYSRLLGTSGVFVMGVGSLALGLVVMEVWARTPAARAFFHGETLHRDTPVLVPED